MRVGKGSPFKHIFREKYIQFPEKRDKETLHTHKLKTEMKSTLRATEYSCVSKVKLTS